VKRTSSGKGNLMLPVDVGEPSGKFCQDCGKPLVWVQTEDHSAREELCTTCGLVRRELPNGHLEHDGDQYGRAPEHAAVFWNNLGTVPGYEMKREVMSALNQDPRTYHGLKFVAATRELLTLWRSAGPVDQEQTQQIFGDMIKTVESKRCMKIDEPHVAALGSLALKCVKAGGRVRHLSRDEIRQVVQSNLTFEELWPP
jgi:hypothetical protein